MNEFFACVYVCVHMYALCLQAPEPEAGIGSSEPCVIDDCKRPCWCQKLNLGPSMFQVGIEEGRSEHMTERMGRRREKWQEHKGDGCGIQACKLTTHEAETKAQVWSQPGLHSEMLSQCMKYYPGFQWKFYMGNYFYNFPLASRTMCGKLKVALLVIFALITPSHRNPMISVPYSNKHLLLACGPNIGYSNSPRLGCGFRLLYVAFYSRNMVELHGRHYCCSRG